MSLVINTNIASLEAQDNLTSSQASLNTSVERLSSGLRINSAADDAAGLAISTRFTSQINGDNQAVNNANDAVSLAQTAEGSLTSMTNNLQTIRQLAVQASNGTNSASDRAALDTEAQQLLQEVNREANASSFNGVSLLNGTNASFTFQVGAGTTANDTITVSGVPNSTTGAIGNVTQATVQSASISSLSALGAQGTGTLTITTASGTTDIGPLAAESTSSARAADVVSAVNAVSNTTGVGAYVDSATDKIVLTSAKSFSLGGSDTGTATGFAASTGVTATAATSTGGLGTLSLLSYSGAQTAINQVDSALATINTTQATLGAVQNRFTSVVSNLQSTATNLTSARSSIQDTDFAAETANMTQESILQQAGTAVLAQANSLPKNVLSLLQNL
jgi:flagellin